ncbi:MAG: RimK/LysX family protein [Lacipirellulaceae bacterium]
MFPSAVQSLYVATRPQLSRAIRFVVFSALIVGISAAPSLAKEGQKPTPKQESQDATKTQQETRREKQVIGAVASVEEKQSDLVFTARVDTGATTSSIHVEDWKIADQAQEMTKNLGKKIRFLIKNEQGKSKWLERKITEISVIKTSEREETRYKVPVTLVCNGVKKRVLVSLNDRSHMKYPMLLGRNYLEGDFLVDVEIDE